MLLVGLLSVVVFSRVTGWCDMYDTIQYTYVEIGCRVCRLAREIYRTVSGAWRVRVTRQHA